MLKKTFLGVLFAVFVLVLLIAGINLNITKAADYGGLGTTVGGIIWENTTWTLENSPYIITDTVQIPENVTLTIEPGVTVFKSKACDMFLLHGRIFAHGTIDDKIIFDGRGYANLVIVDHTIVSGRTSFFNTEDSNSNTFLDMDYCIVKNGVSFWWGGHGSFSLRHSELRNLMYYSYVWYSRRDVVIEYNKFIHTNGISIGTNGDVKVQVRYNLFKKKYASLILTSEFCIKNWASYDGSETVVEYNSFIDMDGIVLELSPGYDSAAMNATENYWVTLNTSLIDSMIYDRNDDINCAGFIDYLPILTEPHPDTPILPIIVNFTCSPSTLYAPGTVTFNASTSFGPYSSIANYTWDFGDGNNITLNTPIATHIYTMPGHCNVTLTVTDEFGFKNSTSTTLTLLQDDIPPITVDDYDGLWHNADFTVILTATDHESGVSETYYRINNGPIQNVSTHGQPLIARESTNNTLEYWSVDNAGNEEPHKVLTEIKLDKTAPTSSINISGDVGIGDWFVSDATASMNATDDLSGIDSIKYSFDNLTWTTYTTPFTITDEGYISIYYKSTDKAGNAETIKTETIKIDKTPPSGSILINENATYVNSTSVTLTLSADDVTSGVTQMRFSNDNVTWTPWEAYSTSKAWALTTGDEAKIVYVQFMDNAGLISNTYTDNIILDTVLPIIGIPLRIPEGDVQPGQDVKVSVNVTDSMSGVKSVRLKYSSNRSVLWLDFPMTFNSTTGLWEFVIPGQQANTLVKYRIEAYDNALNHKVDDNSGQYYVYTVIPEFPQPIILLLFAFTTLIATILLKKKARPKSPPQFSFK